jgi:hypothetical protein
MREHILHNAARMTEGQSRPFLRQRHCRNAATPTNKRRQLLCLTVLFVIGLFLARFDAQAGSPITADTPIGFFTNVASRLLQSELGLNLTNIQVYPTNQYTPAVHRLLQVAANIYDSTTNRDFNGAGYPYLPTVFRPLFRRAVIGTNTVVVIAGYREVVGISIIAPGTGSPEVELDTDPLNVNFIPPLGTPPGTERAEPLVSGFPLVIGAKTGLPNFNEFAMQTYIYVSRFLEFRRVVINGPVVSTNQMYVASITNAFGVEAWNSYSNIHPRNLQMLVRADMTAIVTNELGNMLVSNRVTEVTNTILGPWPGWTNANAMQASFVLPWSTSNGCIFLANATYNSTTGQFIPLTHIFSYATHDIYDIPHWFLNLNTRIRFVLVDTAADRIVDYVHLNNWQPTMDVNAVLATGSDCNPINYNNIGNPFCTNRQGGSFNTRVPTFGLLSQIAAGLVAGLAEPDLRSFNIDPYAGTDAHRAIDGFRYNLMGWGPHYYEDQTVTFYKSNVFYAPLLPYRPVYVHSSWSADDPLVHYTVSDLTDLTLTNQVNFASDNPPLFNLGYLNGRYQPWGGSPSGTHHDPMPPYQSAAKDPLVIRADCWQFPTNQPLSPIRLGQVHRGTPWQTVFLKSTNILLSTSNVLQGLALWQAWTGNSLVRPDWAHSGQLAYDAAFTTPTNDWHILNSLAPLLNTNPPPSLSSPNQRSPQGWLALLNGIQVLTNSAPGQLDVLVMSSNSPQAMYIAQGLDRIRQQQPGQIFAGIGDILATPELSMASPWLNLPDNYVTEEVYEIIPAQLLAKLRPDSIGSLSAAGGAVQVRFTGFDPYAYAVQVSSNLTDWVSVSTNSPSSGVFDFLDLTSSNSPARFYRSAVLP